MNEKVKYKQGKMPRNLDGLGHHGGARTIDIKIINGKECIKFVSHGDLKEDEYIQTSQDSEVPL
jgi:hypothetical protein